MNQSSQGTFFLVWMGQHELSYSLWNVSYTIARELANEQWQDGEMWEVWGIMGAFMKDGN
ncbi:MAG: hypothetical protein AB4041_21545 [Microcystaceae cyanobacterium]